MSKTLKHGKTKRVKKKTKKQKGGEFLPDSSSLTLEFIFNNFIYEKYPNYYFEETPPEKIEKNKEESKTYMQQIQSFVSDMKETNGIPYSINSSPPKSLIDYLLKYTNADDDVCKGIIDLRKLDSSFYGQRPSVCILLKYNDTIIGVAVISFTHRNFKQKFGNKINITKSYIFLDWLCGSKYNKVGTILVKTIDKLQEYMNTNSIQLISYNSAIPFYKKMGFEYVGLSGVGTPMMEKR